MIHAVVLLGFLSGVVVAYPQYGFEPMYRPAGPEYCVRRRTRQEAPQGYQPQRRELDDFVSQSLTHDADYPPHRFFLPRQQQHHDEYDEARLCREHPEMCRPRVRVERVIYVDYPPELEGYYVAPTSIFRRKKKRVSGAVERPPVSWSDVDDLRGLEQPQTPADLVEDIADKQLSRREDVQTDPAPPTEVVIAQKSE